MTTAATAATTATTATMDRHLAAIMQRDVDAIVRDYAEDAVLFTQDGPLVGRAAVRAFFEGFLAAAPPELLAATQIVRLDVRGEVAYIVWKAEPAITLATDTFVVRDGTITAQTFVMLGAPTT